MRWTDLISLPRFPERSVIIVGGVHGSGKSTLCDYLCQRQNLVHLSPQNVEKLLAPERLTWQDLLKEVRNRVATQFSIGASFCFEHVLSGHYINRLIDEARSASFSIHLIYLNVAHANRAIDRIRQRVTTGGHDVDYDLVGQRLHESRRNFWHRYRLHADHWHLFENSDCPFNCVAEGCRDVEVTINNQALLDSFVRSLESTQDTSASRHNVS